jgi:hypothetical protein
MKNTFLIFALWMLTQTGMFVSHGQVTGQISRLRLPYLSEAEKANLPTMAEGFVFYLESNPGSLWITTGNDIAPAIRLNPPQEDWSHSAARDIQMNQYALLFDGRYNLRGDGVSSQWDALGTAMIRLTGGVNLVRVISLVYDSGEDEVTLVIDAGQAGVTPTVQWTASLVTPSWATVSGAVVSESGADGRSTAVFTPPAAVAFYRVQVPEIDPPKIELLANTEITGTLSVSGAITGSLNSTNLVGNIPAGLLPAVVTQIEAEAGTVTDPRTWTPERVKQAILALSPPTVPSITTTSQDSTYAWQPSRNGDVLKITLTGAVALTLSDPATTTVPLHVTVEAIQDGTGGRVLTLAGNVSTPGAVQPTLSATANAVDLLQFVWTGSKWRWVNSSYAQGNL